MGKRSCPTGKVCHPTRAAAERARVHTGLGRAYRCEGCGAYHLATKSKNARGWRQRKHRTVG